MSYILDALRRADAERELGDVPTLHTQAVPLAAADDGFDAPPHKPWRWVALAVGLLAAGVAAWWHWGSGRTQPTVALVATAPVVQPIAEAAPPPVVTPQLEPSAATVDVTASAAVVQPSPAQEIPVTVAPTLPQKQAGTPAPALAASNGASKKVASTGSSRAETKPLAKAQAAASQDVVPTQNELPEAIRREQPKLSVGGAMHSANPANRMLILNGQVFHEGDQVTADLVLEQIKLKSAVLVYKGYRYSISY